MNPEYQTLLNAARSQAQERANREQRVQIIYEDDELRVYVRPCTDLAPADARQIEAVSPEKDTGR